MSQIKLLHKPDNKAMSVAVFVSGSGTNLLALYEEQKKLERSGETNYGRIDLVFSNVPNCIGVERAKEFGLPVLTLSSKSYFESLRKSPDDDEARELYDSEVIALIEETCNPDLIVLAGYRRRLSRLFVKKYQNKIVNLYPGDITKPYLVRGVDAAIQALRAGEKEIKCTVYIQAEDERFGPALVQSHPVSLDGFIEQDVEKIQEKIRKEAEWQTLPFAVHHLIAKGRVAMDAGRNIYVDGKRLPRSGFQLFSPGI